MIASTLGQPNHVISGTPIYQLKELGSWSSMEMVQKYAHLNVEHLKKFADSLLF